MSTIPTPPRVLQYTYGGSHISGIDTYLLETYRAIDRSSVQFDFLFRYELPYSSTQSAEISDLGGRTNALQVRESQNPLLKQLNEARRLWSFFKRNRYEVVEINMTSIFMCIQAGLIARLHGARRIVLHSHDAATHENRPKRLLKNCFTWLLKIVGTDYWACSPEAAEYLFGRRHIRSGNWRFVKNPINVDRFKFDALARQFKRSELKLEGKYAVGAVGRFAAQKNFGFAVRVFAERLKNDPSAHLVLVGNGPELEQVTKLADELGISNNVSFLGARSDVPALLSAFDSLLAPSRHEGFPIIGLEAQAAGLPALVSEAFPPTTAVVPGALSRIPLSMSAEFWASQFPETRSPENRAGAAQRVLEAGYDRKDTAKAMNSLYEEIFDESGSQGRMLRRQRG